MKYEEVVNAVRVEAGISSIIEADRATQATLRVLALRLSANRERTRPSLPASLVSEFVAEEGTEQFDAHEFVLRVARRCGTDVATARTRARTVLDVIHRYQPAGLATTLAALSSDYADLLEKKMGHGPDVSSARNERRAQ